MTRSITEHETTNGGNETHEDGHEGDLASRSRKLMVASGGLDLTSGHGLGLSTLGEETHGKDGMRWMSGCGWRKGRMGPERGEEKVL